MLIINFSWTGNRGIVRALCTAHGKTLWYPRTRLHGVTTQKVILRTGTAVRISDCPNPQATHKHGNGTRKRFQFIDIEVPVMTEEIKLEPADFIIIADYMKLSSGCVGPSGRAV